LLRLLFYKNDLKRKLKFIPDVLFDYKVYVLNQANIYTISPSKWLQNKVCGSAVFDSSTNLHIPNGVDVNKFRPLNRVMLRKKYNIPETAKVIIFLSANLADERKGFYYFAKSLEKLKNVSPSLIGNTITLLVGGNSDLANSFLSTEIRNLGWSKTTEKLVEYYNLADVFISASIADNFPSTCLESIACGTPVVAFDVGGVSEIVIDEKTGLLVKSKDIDGLANNIQEILTNESLRNQLSVDGRNYVVENFSMDKFSETYLQYFKKATDMFEGRKG